MAIEVDLVASGVAAPTFATSAPGAADQLYITERNSGRVTVLDLTNNQVSGLAFFDVPAADLSSAGESFDRATGDLYIGDVGQDAREEIDFLAAGTRRGYELRLARHGRHAGDGLPDNLITRPPTIQAHEYGRSAGGSIIGGYVYRGPGGAQGEYFFADFLSDRVWTARVVDGNVVALEQRDDELVFVNGADKLALDGAAFTAIGAAGGFVAGDARFWSSSTGTAHDADDRVIFNTSTGSLITTPTATDPVRRSSPPRYRAGRACWRPTSS